jgi:hypothetical protein
MTEFEQMLAESQKNGDFSNRNIPFYGIPFKGDIAFSDLEIPTQGFKFLYLERSTTITGISIRFGSVDSVQFSLVAGDTLKISEGVERIFLSFSAQGGTSGLLVLSMSNEIIPAQASITGISTIGTLTSITNPVQVKGDGNPATPVYISGYGPGSSVLVRGYQGISSQAVRVSGEGPGEEVLVAGNDDQTKFLRTFAPTWAPTNVTFAAGASLYNKNNVMGLVKATNYTSGNNGDGHNYANINFNNNAAVNEFIAVTTIPAGKYFNFTSFMGIQPFGSGLSPLRGLSIDNGNVVLVGGLIFDNQGVLTSKNMYDRIISTAWFNDTGGNVTIGFYRDLGFGNADWINHSLYCQYYIA